MRQSNADLDKYSAVELYKLILSGHVGRFPAYFWKNDFSFDYAKEIGFYIINEHFNNEDSRILDGYGNAFVNRVKLHSVLKLFNGRAFDYIDFLFPNRFKPWEFKSCPNAFWNSENAIIATQWLIDSRLCWNENEVKDHLNYRAFVDNKLGGMLSQVHNDSVFSALNAAYPDKYKPWDLKRVSVNFWKYEQNVINALTWLINDKLHLSSREVPNKLTIDVLVQNGFSGMLRWYHGIPYHVLEHMYPDIDWEQVKILKNRYK